MIAASTAAAVYCLILSRRLSRLTSFDSGLGGAIAVLSAQVDDMRAALAETKTGTDRAGTRLGELVRQASEISKELELMIAACHDFAEEALVVQADAPARGSGSHPAMGTADATPAASVVPEGSDPAPERAAPVFGTRRQPSVEPMFRRRAQA